jgi:predicted DNA-binding transcriptional regulator AlpA
VPARPRGVDAPPGPLVYEVDTTALVSTSSTTVPVVRIDLNDLLNAKEAAELLGLSHREAISTYRGRYEDFPEPVLKKGTCVLWSRKDLETWMSSRQRTS